MSEPDVTFLRRDKILEATERFTTPFFIYDEERLRHNCRRFRDAFRRYFPDFEPLYAVKANPNPEVLKIIIDEGFAMDASGEAEAWLSNKLNVGGMYTSSYTTAATLKYAKERGFILNLDDISNIPSLAQIGVPEIISFRINPGIGKSTNPSCVMAGPEAKYGVPHYKAAEAYRLAKQTGVKRFGIHMMTGSNVPLDEQNYFRDIVEKLFEVVVEVRDSLGIEIEFMDIGGGFGVPYHPDEPPLDLNTIAAGIKDVFDQQCAKFNLKPPRLMAEPGRIISADAGWLVTKVTVIKDSYKKFVGVDASSNDMPRPSIYGAYHHISVLNSEDRKLETVSVVGSICENNDQFARDRELPVCNIGDVVVIHNCGAHAYSMGHNYNGRLRHAEYLLEKSGDIRQIRRAEELEDYFKTVVV